MTDRSPLRVLIVEDSPDDAHILAAELGKTFPDLHWRRVASREEMQTALREEGWDALLVDYSMPAFSAMSALQILAATALDLPFICVSGAVRWERAIELLHAGAHDFVDKNDLARLCPALERELASARQRQNARENLSTLAVLSKVVEQSPATIIITDAAGRIEYVNAAYTQTTGFTAEESIGKKVSILASGKTSPEVYQSLWSALSNGRTWRGEIMNRRRNGQEYWDDVVISPIMDEHGEIAHFAGIQSDVSVRKQAEEDLSQSQAILSSVFAAAPTGMGLMVERDFKMVNQKMCAITGLDEAEMVGASARILYATEEEFERVGREKYAQLLESGVGSVETQFQTKDGALLDIWLSSASVDPQDRSQGTVFTALDITDKKRTRDQLEERVAERTDELQQANQQLQDLDRLKSLFLASVSHELRTPLNSILGFTGVVLQGMAGQINERQRDHLSRVYGAARHLLTLISDVIDISKVEAGHVEVEADSFQLHELVNEAIGDLGIAAAEKGLSLNADVPPGIRLHTDRKRLLQCLLNLLSNAVKYTDSGEIRVKSIESEDRIAIAVTDNGPGIDPNEASRLFEPFSRLRPRERKRTDGAGLGLYMTRKLVDTILQGTVEARSTPGHGSTFVINIPREIQVPVQNEYTAR